LSAGEHVVPDDLVLDVVEDSRLTAYDAEFVALATALDVPLVTADRAILKTCPERALSMERYLEAYGRE
jgi:predicted nucleic acid-binding protein